jgi:hypothetical protein
MGRHGFAGTPEEHKAEAKESVSLVGELSDKFNAAIAAGRCGEAKKAFLRIAIQLGKQRVHHSAYRAHGGFTLDDNIYADQLSEGLDEYVERCAIK